MKFRLSRFVFNLSRRAFDQTIIDVLDLGEKFIPTKKYRNRVEYQQYIATFVRKLKLMDFFSIIPTKMRIPTTPLDYLPHGHRRIHRCLLKP